MAFHNTSRFARCLAENMRDLDPAAWPHLVERFRDTMELTGFDGSVTLSGEALVLTSDRATEAFPLGRRDGNLGAAA